MLSRTISLPLRYHGSMFGRAALHRLVLAAVLLAACSPQEALTPRLTSDVEPTPTPSARSQQSRGSAELTAEQGLAVLMEAWSRLSDASVDAPDPVELLRAAWDGFTSALPPGQARPPFPTFSSGDPQADMARFRAAYLGAAAQAGGGLEGQAELAYAGIRKMVASTNDCLTVFTDARQVQDQAAQQTADTRIGGVGIRIKHKPNEPILIWELLDGGSAGKAGIKPGDAIVKVDGREMAGQTLEQIATAIRGPEGSSVKLTVERADGKRTQDFTLKRVPLAEPPIQSKMLRGDVLYVRLLGFSPAVQDQLLATLRDNEAKNPKGWIFDLRTNASADYTAMTTTLSRFLKDGPFGYEQTQEGRRAAIGPIGTLLPKQRPYALLVSDSTSSAAEVFAAAVQHHRSGRVVGTKTAGCAGVGGRFQLADGSVLQFPVRRIVGPGGAQLNRSGLIPEVNVEVSRTELATGKDPQLDRALALLGAPAR